MSRLIPLTATALALMLAAPTAALAGDPGNGKGGDRQERGNRGGGDDRVRSGAH